MKKAEDLDGIIEGCKRSEGRAQEQLFRLFFGKMLAVSIRYISDRDSAQDVVQDGFIKIFEHIGNFDQKGSIEGWMRRIIANQAIDYIRKKKKENFVSTEENEFRLVAEEGEDIENWNMTTLKAEIAMDAIENLSPAYRAVFNLAVMENYTHKEIAEMLNINEGTSKSNLAKAKMNLQNFLKKKFDIIENE